MLDTPILLIIFNRPETTRQVFDTIKKAQPKQLFIAADGPRDQIEGEKERCEESRRIATEIDWPCEIKTLFRSENLGCGKGPANAIDWFFEHVEQGIILEDDCLPSDSFYIFCDELLNKYSNNPEVMIISGTNPLEKFNTIDSYVFSKHAGIWGWATWRRAWEKYDYAMKSWKQDSNKEKVRNYFSESANQDYYLKQFEKTYKQQGVTWWDYQWYYCRIINNGLGIVPAKNLISNIGFGLLATHTFNADSKEAKMPAYELQKPLKHPANIERNLSFDRKVEKRNKISLFDKVVFKIKKFLSTSTIKRK